MIKGYLCQVWRNVRGILVIIRSEAWWWRGWVDQKRVILAWRNFERPLLQKDSKNEIFKQINPSANKIH